MSPLAGGLVLEGPQHPTGRSPALQPQKGGCPTIRSDSREAFWSGTTNRVAPNPYAPIGVKTLPLKLQRSENVTRFPGQIAAGRLAWLAVQQGSPGAVLMPQSVLYRNWTRNTGFQTQGRRKPPLQDPGSVLDALRAAQGQPMPSSSAWGIQTYPDFVRPMAQAAAEYGGASLPPIRPVDTTQYITRIRPTQQRMSAPEEAFAQARMLARAIPQYQFHKTRLAQQQATLARQRAVSTLLDGTPTTMQPAGALRGLGVATLSHPTLQRLQRHALEHRLMKKHGVR